MRLRLAALAAASVLTTAVLAQTSSAPQSVPASRHPEAGGILIRNYAPETYDGGPQNWALLQDSRGVIYVGSTNSLLEYDGVNWRKIFTSNRTTVRPPCSEHRPMATGSWLRTMGRSLVG